MAFTRHLEPRGARWALDERYVQQGFGLANLLQVARSSLPGMLAEIVTAEPAAGPLLAPVEPAQEIWAAGVTYLRSREARMAESRTADIYDRVYAAERAEIFFKAPGWRTMGHGQPIRVRRDSRWNVPEPELAIVINARGEIVGYTAGNDVSSRDIEGANPLYLPQAKVYDGSCAVGPGIVFAGADEQRALPIRMRITRAATTVFEGETSSAQLKRSLEELAGWLTRELSFPQGAILLTGTCLVPPEDFTLQPGDTVRIEVGALVLENPVA